jgi:excisionase family DNA binding protein
MQDEWLGLSEAAEMLGVHPSTVRAWADQGRVPVHKTSGGHRRFKKSEMEMWMEWQQADGAGSIDDIIQSALGRTRLQISEGHLEKEPWYQKLDDAAREQYRRSGRYLLQGLIAALVSNGEAAEAESRALGFEYATRGKRCGLTCAEATHAFLFFRTVLLESLFSVYERAAVSSPHLWGNMFRQINSFTDSILIHLLETYETFNKGADR